MNERARHTAALVPGDMHSAPVGASPRRFAERIDHSLESLSAARPASQRGSRSSTIELGDPLVDPTQPVALVLRRGAEMHRAPVNRNAANVGRVVSGDEGGRRPKEGGTPRGGWCGREVELVERVPALDAGHDDTR